MKHDNWTRRAVVSFVSDGEAGGHRPDFCKTSEEICVDNRMMMTTKMPMKMMKT